MATTWITSLQIHDVKRLMEDAFEEADPDGDGTQRLLGQGDTFKADLVALIRRFTAKTSNFELARQILGDDFISPEEIAVARGLTYTEAQTAELERTLPDRETLEWLRRNDYYLMAGSPSEMSLLDVRELKRSYFYSKKNGWYANETEDFARTEKVTCRWCMIRKGIVPNSTCTMWGKQQGLLGGVEIVPTAVELVWALTCYKAVRGVYLLGSLYARTSSVGSNGNHVDVGCFDGDGLAVNDWDDGDRRVDLGLSAARKAA